MKTIMRLLVLALFIGTSVQAQSTSIYEKIGDQLKVTRYFENTDQVKEVGYFKDGKSHGQWTEYSTNGDIRIEATYVDGQKEGAWFVWSDDRKTLHEVNYQANRIANHREWSLAQENQRVEK
jgi:antitoxin component YwqK of YwqJK toxin-antitoxin module